MSSLHVVFSFLATKLVILVLVHYEPACSSEPPGDPTIVCRTYISEGESATCDCQARFVNKKPPDFSLTWPGHSDTSSLQLKQVSRTENGSLFTCLMVWNRKRRLTNYTLQVAYGPDDTHTTIKGPEAFVTNGTQILTLTCSSTAVNPLPMYTWDTDRCMNVDRKAGTCTFIPQPELEDGRQFQCAAKSQVSGNTGVAVYSLNLLYPPREPPLISGYTPGDVISRDSQLWCSVGGGKPSVSDVIFTCSSVKYINFTWSVEGTVTSVLVIIDTNCDDKIIVCTCRAVWSIQERMYKLTSQIQAPIRACEDVCGKEYVGWIGGLFVGAIVASVLCVIVFYLRTKLKAKTPWVSRRKGKTKDSSPSSLTQKSGVPNEKDDFLAEERSSLQEVRL